VKIYIRRITVLGVLCILLFFKNACASYWTERAINSSLAMEEALKEAAIRDAFLKAQVDFLKEEIIKEDRFFRAIIKLDPYLSMGIKYNDNILQTPANQESDLISTIRAGVLLTLGGKFDVDLLEQIKFTPTLSLDLGTTMIYYKDHPQYNLKAFSSYGGVGENFLGGLLGGFVPDINFAYNLGKNKNKLKFRYSLAPDIVGLSSVVVGGTGQLGTITNNAELSWEQVFNRLGYRVGLKGRSLQYESAYEASNYQDIMLALTGFTKIASKTRIFAEADFGMGQYPQALSNSSDSTYYKAWIGTEGRLTNKITGTPKVGYSGRMYKSGESISGIVVSLDLLYKKSEKLSFGLNLSRESDQGDYASQGADEITRAGLRGNYAFNSRFSATLGILDFTYEDYEGGLKSSTYNSFIGLKYMFAKWFDLYLDIRHMEKHTNDPLVGYMNNVVSLTANAKF